MPQGPVPSKIGKRPPPFGSQTLIALGSNLSSEFGDPASTLKYAVDALGRAGAVIRAVSRFYATPAFPSGAGPDYVNAAVLVASDWSAQDTLVQLHVIEAAAGRERMQRWGQRTLDMDLIAIGDQIFPDENAHLLWRNLPVDMQKMRTPDQLVLPHPRVQDRAFVLVPLADVAPDWRHPILGLSVRQMRDALPKAQLDAVKALE
ncbi:MAG: 2-amino-4-hydroxy-6-hydroxymethyldihydropteridine diphosphokinase [Sulfitobacter sp.]